MTTLREAAQQALEALEWHYQQGHSNTLGGFRLKMDEKAIRTLKAALAQPEQCQCSMTTKLVGSGCQYCNPEYLYDYDALSQKHLASIKRDMRISLEDAAVRATHKVMAEYETSAQRPWVGLTDEEIFSVLDRLQVIYNRPPTGDGRVIFARAIETKLKEKNHE